MILLVDETGTVAPGAPSESESSDHDNLQSLGRVSQSGMVVILMLMGFAMVLSASLIYLFESEHCEDTGVDCTGPSAFESIPSAFWWSIATLTTVGYGDMVPHTVAGKVIGGLTSVLGVIIVAIGIALVTINFRECYTEERARADNQRRGLTAKRGDSEARQQKREQDEIDRLKEEFDTCSKELLQKLKQVRTDDRVLPMLQALEKHTVSFSGDVQDFVKHLLSAKRWFLLGRLSSASCARPCATQRFHVAGDPVAIHLFVHQPSIFACSFTFPVHPNVTLSVVVLSFF